MQISENEQVFAQDIRRRKSGRKKETGGNDKKTEHPF